MNILNNRKNQPASTEQFIVITGASKGIGEACALHLDQKGFRVFAGVRNPSDGEALRKRASDRLVPVQLDITKSDDLSAAVERVTETTQDKGLLALINNAGISVPAPLEFIPLDAFRNQLEVNVTAQLAVTQAFLPLLRQTKGRIINISSVGAHRVQPYVGAYHVSKFALEGLTQALRLELTPFGIEVIAIEPSMIATPMWDTASSTARTLLKEMPPQAQQFYGAGIASTLAGAAHISRSGIPATRVAQTVYQALTDSRPQSHYSVP